MGESGCAAPHGLFELLKALRNSNISVLSCLLCRAAFTGANFVAFIRWSAPPGNPINVLSAPHCPLCRSISVFYGSGLAQSGRGINPACERHYRNLVTGTVASPSEAQPVLLNNPVKYPYLAELRLKSNISPAPNMIQNYRNSPCVAVRRRGRD